MGAEEGGSPGKGEGRRRARRRRSYPERACQNCGDPGVGDYCPRCGQRKVDVAVSLPAMLGDMLEDELLLGRRLPRTLSALLLRPGLLTQEVVRGRVVRYVRPLKLYLVSSVVFFLLLSFVTLRAIERVEFGPRDDSPDSPLVFSRGTGAGAGGADAVPDAAEPVAPTPPDTAPDGPGGVAYTTPSGTGRLADVSVNSGSERVDSAIAARLRRLGAMEPEAALQEGLRTFLGYGPTALFLLLPLFAAVLKLLYVRSGRFYVEHVVFLLHLHSFAFVVFTFLLLTWAWLPAWAVSILLGWVLIYACLAMKRVYGQSWAVTLVKYWTLGWAYFWLLAVSVPLLLVATFLLLPA